MKNLRARLLERTSLIGTFTAIPHPVAVEIAAAAGPDLLCIDWEHSQISRDRIEDLIRACDVHSVPAMVRVPGHAPESIAAVLDAGAKAVLVPRVSTAEQARKLVEAVRYPPLGRRGLGPGRAAAYGYGITDYLMSANESIALVVQVETAEGLANIEEIASTDGIDMIFIGPGDLSISIDAIGAAGEKKLQAAMETITTTALSKGRTAGLFLPTADDIGFWTEKGVSLFLLASDTMLLGSALAQGLSKARSSAS